jgi:hypothetical protein
VRGHVKGWVLGGSRLTALLTQPVRVAGDSVADRVGTNGIDLFRPMLPHFGRSLGPATGAMFNTARRNILALA